MLAQHGLYVDRCSRFLAGTCDIQSRTCRFAHDWTHLAPRYRDRRSPPRTRGARTGSPAPPGGAHPDGHRNIGADADCPAPGTRASESRSRSPGHRTNAGSCTSSRHKLALEDNDAAANEPECAAVALIEEIALGDAPAIPTLHPAFRFMDDVAALAGVDPADIPRALLVQRFVLAPGLDHGLALAPLAALGPRHPDVPRIFGYLWKNEHHLPGSGILVHQAATLRRTPQLLPSLSPWWVYWVDAWRAAEAGCRFTRRPGPAGPKPNDAFTTPDCIPPDCILRHESWGPCMGGIVDS